MKISNRSEVGQIRRSRGISINIRTNDETLESLSAWPKDCERVSVHQDHAEDDEEVEVEDVGNAQGQAQDDTQNTEPTEIQSVLAVNGRLSAPKGVRQAPLLNRHGPLSLAGRNRSSRCAGGQGWLTIGRISRSFSIETLRRESLCAGVGVWSW
jgi:hypothetical protein